MPPDDIESKIRKRPFQPFRMYLTDGSSYDVWHPEWILLGRRSLVLGLFSTPAKFLYDKKVDIDLLHIVRTEDMEAPATKNGPA